MHRRTNYPLPCLLWLFLLPLMAHSQVSMSCVSRTLGLSYCVNFNRCEPLITMKNRDNSSNDYLDSLACGSDGEDPLVCCMDQRSTMPLEWPNGPLSPPFCGVTPNKPNKDSTWAEKIHRENIVVHDRWPWMAALGYLSTTTTEIFWRCGGTLISGRHVLTAAHCVYQQKYLYYVRLKIENLGVFMPSHIAMYSNYTDYVDEPREKEMKSIYLIENTSIHPEYNILTFSNDIAVLKLATEVNLNDFEFGTIRPICLPIPEHIQNTELRNKQPYVVGLGTSSRKIGVTNMGAQESRIPIFDNEGCRVAYSNTRAKIDQRVICTGPVKVDENICWKYAGGFYIYGNMGGPLMNSWPTNTSDPVNNEAYYAIGILSYGNHRCGQQGRPAVFMKVAEYLDFILSKLN